MRAADNGELSLDFTFDEAAFHDEYGERRRSHGAQYYGSLGIAREDVEGRRIAGERNLSFFGAPHVALMFMPNFGDGVRAASDVGMYAQTFLLALAARGLGGVPQTVIGFYADAVREVLGVPETQKLLFGVSFGFPADDAHLTQVRTPREDVARAVVFHG